ncbi:AAR2 family protein [Cordyceps fumosorosea ARSEF 2679]|uniref:AAR2 family protein n=1 Tax=Cordyceps fumosorosea (strain ARSEF 2679) TaxID=1081104 RepID=A0A167Q381_CORFA|nr:AAR2 family protein [Cordyceps fumosorosea ARSEF 2679]OAA57242.1 AAR2 family protein [Cordyceps fumosorosea ARSEF 2679]
MTHHTSSSSDSARHRALLTSSHVATAQQHVNDAPPPLGSLDDPDSDQEEEAPASRAYGGGGDVVVMLGLPHVFTVGCDDIAGGGGDGGQAVVRWDDAAEQLVDAGPDDLHAVTAPDVEKLLPYHDPTAGGADEARTAGGERTWGQLTSAITAELLSRVTGQRPLPQQSAVWHMSTTDRVRGEPPPSAAELAMERQIAGTGGPPPPPPRELRFSLDQHAKTYSAARLGADRTRDATDATSYLLSALDGDVTEADLVGEMQLAFLAGAHLGSDACIAQWFHASARLFLRAHALPRLRPSLAAAWLRALAAQLAHGGTRLEVPLGEMLGEARARELRLALIVYKRRLQEEEEEEQGEGMMEVVMAFAGVEAAVAGEGWDWDLGAEYVRRGRVVMEDGEEVELEMDELQAEDERGEWAPEVVELDEHGREKGLISWND